MKITRTRQLVLDVLTDEWQPSEEIRAKSDIPPSSVAECLRWLLAHELVDRRKVAVGGASVAEWRLRRSD